MSRCLWHLICSVLHLAADFISARVYTFKINLQQRDCDNNISRCFCRNTFLAENSALLIRKWNLKKKHVKCLNWFRQMRGIFCRCCPWIDFFATLDNHLFFQVCWKNNAIKTVWFLLMPLRWPDPKQRHSFCHCCLYVHNLKIWHLCKEFLF